MAVVIPHTLVGPVKVLGDTLPYTANAVPGMLPQAFTADTLTEPSVNVEAMLTVTELVPAPLVKVIPAGIVQRYEVAPNAGGME